VSCQVRRAARRHGWVIGRRREGLRPLAGPDPGAALGPAGSTLEKLEDLLRIWLACATIAVRPAAAPGATGSRSPRRNRILDAAAQAVHVLAAGLHVRDRLRKAVLHAPIWARVVSIVCSRVEGRQRRVGPGDRGDIDGADRRAVPAMAVVLFRPPACRRRRCRWCLSAPIAEVEAAAGDGRRQAEVAAAEPVSCPPRRPARRCARRPRQADARAGVAGDDAGAADCALIAATALARLLDRAPPVAPAIEIAMR